MAARNDGAGGRAQAEDPHQGWDFGPTRTFDRTLRRRGRLSTIAAVDCRV
jgi:hypothetical protein